MLICVPGDVAACSEPVEGVGGNNMLLGGGNTLLGGREGQNAWVGGRNVWLRVETRGWGRDACG